jgi:hypothetical protein
MIKFLILVLSHLGFAGLGFVLGIYTLPILMAPDAPSSTEVAGLEQSATYTGEFKRDLADSDFLHWGEGVIAVAPNVITFQGKLAPGPAYRLYLSPEFVETEAAFEDLKHRMVMVGGIDTFENFIVKVPASVDVSGFNTAIIWCESFGQFITAARYR